MTTTHLFVELLVIGFGTLVWLGLLGAAFFGYDPFALGGKSFSLSTLFPLLTFAYVLGIVTDRLADWVFDRWDRCHLKETFNGDLDVYLEGRRIMALYGRALWDHLEYGRSRLRICRGWVLNGACLLVSFDVFLWKASTAPTLTGGQITVSNIAMLLFVVLCIVCWRKLNLKEYEKINRQWVWLAEQQSRGRDGNEQSEGGSP